MKFALSIAFVMTLLFEVSSKFVMKMTMNMNINGIMALEVAISVGIWLISSFVVTILVDTCKLGLRRNSNVGVRSPHSTIL